jgi:hypothetical protein
MCGFNLSYYFVFAFFKKDFNNKFIFNFNLLVYSFLRIFPRKKNTQISSINQKLISTIKEKFLLRSVGFGNRLSEIKISFCIRFLTQIGKKCLTSFDISPQKKLFRLKLYVSFWWKGIS